MEPHNNNNIYPSSTNKNPEVFGGYVRNPCAQQTSAIHRPQHFLPPYGVPMPMANNMQQQLMYNTHQNQPVYNLMYGPPQTMYRNQNSFTSNTTLNSFSSSQSMDWPESCMKNNGFVKETKKENCCIENSTNVYKTKDLYNYDNKNNNLLEPQWFYSSNCESQKYSELPSCSQITSENATINECCNIKDNNKNIKSVKYCSIQKLPEPGFPYPNKYESNMYLNQYNKITKDYPSCSQLAQTCNLYNGSTCLEIDKKILLEHCEVQNVCEVIQPNQFYPQNVENSLQPFINVPKIHEKTADDSNGNEGESDIVVEDSDEEVTDESEEIDKEEVHPCVVCNLSVENRQFYVISLESTVTSYSQTKVLEKLIQHLGYVSNTSDNICSVCMTLVNTMDNLEIQLDTIKCELIEKYKATIKLCNDENGNNKEINESIDTTGVLNKKLKKKKYKKEIKKSLCFKCRICEKIFSLKKFFTYHISKHKSKKLLCAQCGCSFLKQSNLKSHLLNSCNKNNTNKISKNMHKKEFICHICGKVFKTKTNLKDHENICSGKLPFKCVVCQQKFPSRTKMKQHVKLKHDKAYTEKCQMCNKGFVKHSDFKSHMLIHSSEKNYKCKKCSKIYKTLSNLNHHLKTHSEKLPHICSVCQKGFIRKENLESHLNIHNGLKPFSCKICEKKFASQKNLDAHLKVHNGTTKKKTCNICGKQVIHGLEDHMRIHSNFKAFQCVDCPMTFLTKGALAKHKKRKHENKDLDVLQI